MGQLRAAVRDRNSFGLIDPPVPQGHRRGVAAPVPALPSKRGGPGGGPRIAILGFSIECNKFAPPATKAHFLARTYLEGDDILEEARGATPTMLPETPGFVAAMDAAGPWQPVGIALAMSEPNGPVEHDSSRNCWTRVGRL